MKKSKILIPALAVIGISLAASATATVAWFSATRTRTVGLENVYAIDTSENLKVELSAYTNFGATVDNTTTTVDVNPLTDCSIDATYTAGTHTAPTAFITKKDANGDVSGYKAVDTATNGTKTGKKESVTINETPTDRDVHYFAKFGMKFSISDITSQQYLVYFNLNTGKSKLTLPTGDDETAHLASSLRIAFVKKDQSIASGNDMFVWAPNYDTTTSDTVGNYNHGNTNVALAAAAGPRYVKTTTEATLSDNVKQYNSTNCTIGNTSLAHNDEDVKPADAQNEINYLGMIKGTTDAVVTSSYDAYVWFEGEDYFCKSGETQTTYGAIVAALSFYAVKADMTE